MSRLPIKNLKEKEGITAIFFLVFCTALALKLPVGVGTSNLAPPVGHAAAPWIFGPFQILLLYFPPWLGAIVFPLVLVAGLTSLPWLAQYRDGKAGRCMASILLSMVIVLLIWFMLKEVWRVF